MGSTCEQRGCTHQNDGEGGPRTVEPPTSRTSVQEGKGGGLLEIRPQQNNHIDKPPNLSSVYSKETVFLIDSLDVLIIGSEKN